MGEKHKPTEALQSRCWCSAPKTTSGRLGKSPPDPRAFGGRYIPWVVLQQGRQGCERSSASRQGGLQARGRAGLAAATPGGPALPLSAAGTARVSDGAGDSQCCDSGVNANEAGRNKSN